MTKTFHTDSKNIYIQCWTMPKPRSHIFKSFRYVNYGLLVLIEKQAEITTKGLKETPVSLICKYILLLLECSQYFHDVKTKLASFVIYHIYQCYLFLIFLCCQNKHVSIYLAVLDSFPPLFLCVIVYMLIWMICLWLT